MFYRQKKDTYIRNYGDIGYIVSIGIQNDRVVDKYGAVFLAAVNRTPQSLDEITDKILKKFRNVEREILLKDVEEFLDMLVEDNFLVKAESKEELDQIDRGFTYDVINPKLLTQDFTPAIKRADERSQTYLEKYFAGKPQLTTFQIELTSRCNERCVHCYIPHEYKLYDIEPKLYYDVLEQLSKMGTLSLTLSGGEPMLNPHFKEFLKAAKKYDFYIHILSNLTLLDDEIIEIMKERNVPAIQVSLYSMIPEHHEAITKLPGSFEKTKNAILKLIENNIPVQVSCPTMQINKNDFSDVLKWCHEHKIIAGTDYLMMAKYNHATDNLEQRLTVDEAGKVLSAIVEGDYTYQESLLKSDFSEGKIEKQNPERRICGVGQSSCCMVANGNVYPCAGWQEMVLGNLYENSLKEIWDNSEKIQWLRSLKMKDLGDGECCKCENAAFCSPCLVRNANESATGNPLEINRHFCAVAAKNMEIALNWRNEHLK